jgi:Peptidase family M23
MEDMTAMEISLALLAMSLGLIAWLWLWPQSSKIGLALQSLAALALIVAGWLAAVWTVVPRWTMIVALILWLGAVIRAVRHRQDAMKPKGAAGWVAASLSVTLLLLGGWAISQALLGQSLPPVKSIDLARPLDGSDVAVANGGSRLLINAHQDTLDLSIPRHRLWQGQSYGVDFVALRPLGFTANGLRPADPARYAIFGRPVKAPCNGQIVRLRDGRPDMPVPELDKAVMEGNYVALRCGTYEIMMAHLKRGSIKVRVGEDVTVGTEIGQVGNSGHSDEPHLHINAQTPGTDAAPFSGKSVAMRFEGRFLARNDRLR